MKILEARDIVKVYKNAAGEEFYALNRVNMEIEAGSFVILKGRSGSGKTTLLNIMSALDMPDKGDVLCEGEVISMEDERKREAFRRATIGYVFQAVALMPIMNADRKSVV